MDFFKNLNIIMLNLYGFAKRKTSKAQATIIPGTGKISINGKDLSNFLETRQAILQDSLKLLNIQNLYDVKIISSGGGFSGQLEAARLAISRALSLLGLEEKKILTQNYLLKNDVRIKERRKYGLKKARKAPQYSKR